MIPETGNRFSDKIMPKGNSPVARWSAAKSGAASQRESYTRNFAIVQIAEMGVLAPIKTISTSDRMR
ncbi:MAG: hypothetical protein JWN71_1329 [Xanthobacteraceae bacterium]|nr:hypothetical protein [Xanthobacteraceae bacterium]